MENKWDERYKDQDFAYGKTPNLFFKEWLLTFSPGAILMPADGEGRNGVYAATQGWKVTSFDLSKEGRSKAIQLAKEFNVSIEYSVGDFDQLSFEESFDAIGLIYAHFSAGTKSTFHFRLNEMLKPGGIVILEAFSKKHLEYIAKNPKVGGPKEIGMLYSKEEIIRDFNSYELLLLEEEEIELNEGKYHMGIGSVIRFVGRKP